LHPLENAALHGAPDTQPSQIAIRSSGLSSPLMLVTDGIQLGSLKIFAMLSRTVPTFLSFLAIEITTEFPFVGMAVAT
jgi:hypothetical protein